MRNIFARKTLVSRYGVAVAAVMAAVAMRFLVEQVAENQSTPFLLLFAAVLASAAYGGLGPGLLATVLGAAASDYFFIGPQPYSLTMSLPETIQVLLFMVEGIFISVLGARLQAARSRAENSEAQARVLEQRILDVGEAERRRIGQDLHDGLGQHLTGVAFLSKALQKRLANRNLPEAEDATKIAALVSESIGQTRALAKGLAPVGLEDGGLPAALSQLAAATADVFKIACTVDADESIDIPDIGTSTHLYRIAQEAINNALRHGGADKINVTLRTNDHRLQLKIEDNGRGFAPAAEPNGMGLRIMNFRARMIGGHLEMNRSAGFTSILCTAPLSEKAKTTNDYDN